MCLRLRISCLLERNLNWTFCTSSLLELIFRLFCHLFVEVTLSYNLVFPFFIIMSAIIDGNTKGPWQVPYPKTTLRSHTVNLCAFFKIHCFFSLADCLLMLKHIVFVIKRSQLKPQFKSLPLLLPVMLLALVVIAFLRSFFGVELLSIYDISDVNVSIFSHFGFSAVAKETEFDFWGFIFVMLAAVMSGFRWCMTQILLQVCFLCTSGFSFFQFLVFITT